MCRYENESEQLEENYWVLGMFIEGNLGIIEENIDFIEEEEEINNNKILNEDIIKAM